MIETLTPEQEAKFPEYVEKWTKLGLTTTPLTLDQAEKDFFLFQKEIMQMETPAKVVLVDNPIDTIYLANIFTYYPETKWEDVKDQNFQEFWKKISNNDTPEFCWTYFDCQFWASWFSFYDFIKVELGVKYPNDDKYEIFKDCQKYGLVYPLENLCIVCQPPTVIKTNAAHQLHCENGPAISYNGKWELYALNGVVMKKEHVMTPAEKIDPVVVMKETNVEVRRELLRKVGIERMLTVLPNKMLDKRGNYELYSITLSPTITDARYLKMTNPSIGVFHLEGVAPGTDTVDKALAWRNKNMFVDADILT